jgi:hypothetical protein
MKAVYPITIFNNILVGHNTRSYLKIRIFVREQEMPTPEEPRPPVEVLLSRPAEKIFQPDGRYRPFDCRL